MEGDQSWRDGPWSRPLLGSAAMAGSSVAPSASFAMKGPAIPLSVAFGVASVVVAFAQTNDPAMQLRACSAMEPVERLKCLDDLSRNLAPAVAPAQGDNWIVSETTSPVDYT